MDTNDEKLLFKEQVFQIVGCALEVPFNILYKGNAVGLFIPDLTLRGSCRGYESD